MPTVSCPSCTRPLEVDDAYREWTVRCPHCSTEFVPAEVAPAPLERDDRDDRPRRRDRDRRDDEYEDDYDRPRRRRRRPDPEREEWERHEAVRLAHGPGTWLEVCGWLGGLLLAGTAAFCFLGAMAQANNPNGNGDDITMVFTGLFSAFLTLPYTIVMVVGGRKMRALSGYGWAMTASVVGICSLFLMCCFCSFVPIGIGIWGVVTLNNPIVQRAFERNNYEPRNWDD